MVQRLFLMCRDAESLPRDSSEPCPWKHDPSASLACQASVLSASCQLVFVAAEASASVLLAFGQLVSVAAASACPRVGRMQC